MHESYHVKSSGNSFHSRVWIHPLRLPVVRYSNIKDEFKSFNLPKWLRDLVGILKLSFAIMLLNDNLEIVRLGALGIAILMVAALVTHLRLKSPGHRMLPSFALLCICSYLAFLCSQLLPTAG